MKYSDVQSYFEAIGQNLSKVVKTCASVAEFSEVKRNMHGLTFVVEDLNWKPTRLRENPYSESTINWQMWVPLKDYLNAVEVKAAKDLLQEQADQIVAKLIVDSANYASWMKYLDLNSVDFVLVSDLTNKDAIGLRGEAKINAPATFEIDVDLWN